MDGTDTHPTLPATDLPPGVTLLRTPAPRSAAIHEVALDAVGATNGRAYWLDAQNTASTYALQEGAPDERVIDRIRVARAFTAYQHVSLVERVVNAVSPRTGCIVAPNVASLYRDEDVPGYEADSLLDAAMGALASVAGSFGIPVLVTDAGPDDDHAGVLADHASAEVRCERTEFGYRYDGPGVETTVYWRAGGWQTTIPYWVDLLGAAGQRRPAEAPAGPALRFALEG